MAAASAIHAQLLRYSDLSRRSQSPETAKRGIAGSLKLRSNCSSSTTLLRTSLSLLRASRNEDQNSTAPDSLVSQEELGFLLKLGGGSVIGAAVIKYGSIVFPEITRPNIVLALTIIATPVVVAVLLLIKQSLGDKQT